MLVILHAVRMMTISIGQSVVKTNHNSLKYFLEQRVSSKEQQKWVTKIEGYDFEIVYKKGKDNIVEYALSRKEEEVTLCSMSLVVPSWLEEANQEWKQEPSRRKKIQDLQGGNYIGEFSWKSNILFYKGRIYLSSHSTLKKVLEESHSAPIAGHSVFLKTYQRVKQSFYWDGLKKDTK
eukprot:Gb_16850 [translate_table: standard]